MVVQADIILACLRQNTGGHEGVDRGKKYHTLQSRCIRRHLANKATSSSNINSTNRMRQIPSQCLSALSMRADNNAALLVAHIWLDAMLVCVKGASVRHERPSLSRV